MRVKFSCDDRFRSIVGILGIFEMVLCVRRDSCCPMASSSFRSSFCKLYFLIYTIIIRSSWLILARTNSRGVCGVCVCVWGVVWCVCVCLWGLVCVCVCVRGWCVCGLGLRLAGPLVHCLTVLELLLKAGFQLQQLLINVCILNPSQ